MPGFAFNLDYNDSCRMSLDCVELSRKIADTLILGGGQLVVLSYDRYLCLVRAIFW